MAEQLANAPPEIAAALGRLKEQLIQAAGLNLGGLILYGGLARGRYRPGKSDVNVVVLLKEVSPAALAAIGPALRTARRTAAVSPMILTPPEVRAAAVVFPTKFLDIANHHIVLHGEDPFAGLDVPREQIRLRIVQQLRNLTLRLRRRYLAAFDDRSALLEMLTSVARPIAIEVAALLRLAGKSVPEEDRTAAIFQRAAEAFGLEAESLARLAALRQGESSGDDVQQLYGRVMENLNRLIERAEGF
jgi:hypothetical protein